MVPTAIPAQSHSAVREKLQSELLKSVKQCQTRFGGRTELATELDSNVANLCHNLESALSHGLKTKRNEEKKASTLRQVSELVLGNSSEEGYSLWEGICDCLTPHERDRYLNLKHVWTDRGRARAWLRSALNERSLERYLNNLLLSQNLHVYYEEWALVRDPEITNILPNIAAGLSTILFAISIDRPEMNNVAGSVAPAGVSDEQVIQEPSPFTVKKDKRNKKGPNIISFGDEEEMNNGIVSSEEINDINITVSSPPQTERSQEETIYVGVECAEEAAGALYDADIANSDTETIGEPDTAQNGMLRPVNNCGIGELMPISLSEETHSSEDSISVPSFSEENEGVTKVSAIARTSLDSLGGESCESGTSVEVFNKELEKLQKSLDELQEMNQSLRSQMAEAGEQYKEKLRIADTKVQELNRENELLKHQLRKYVSAVQMLKEESLSEGDSLYEQKLVQVAEMHGELMELNEKLQWNISAKEAIIRRLYLELEALRGPLGPSQIDIHTHIISLWLPSVFLSGSSKPHHVYQVHLRIADEEWNVFRRYTQFYTLHKLTKKQHPIVSAFQFPPKKTIGNKDSKFVEERRLKLQQYLRRLLNHIVANNPALSTSPSKNLLISIVPFFGEQEEINNRMLTGSSPRPRIAHSNSPQYAGL